jgi:23S rRNA (adenine2030-N6)-methyltransferase
MNYRHHYHAGNFADVVKHIFMLALLESLHRKDTPYCYIDTHAGCGVYDLGASEAQKTLEFKTGLSRIRTAAEAGELPEWVSAYLLQVQKMQAKFSGFWYPGSPRLAKQMQRPQDRSVFMEFHPDDVETLKDNFFRAENTSIHHRDAYEGLNALIPPKEKRGLVLIDPPYEEERDDYSPVVELLKKAHQKWPTGMYAIWFPIKDYQQITRFYRRLRNTNIPKMLTTELCVMPADNQLGLNGTGMIIVNPPWQFSDKAFTTLKWLRGVLTEHPQASFKVEWLTAETIKVDKKDDDE